MPKRAIELGSVDDILSDDEIPDGILDATKLEVNA
jgi:two-component system chemotaxis response regulator CheB